MKQNITIEQLNELSEKGRDNLVKWWTPQRGDWFAEKDFENYPNEDWSIDLLEEYDGVWHLSDLKSLEEFTEYVKTNGVQTFLPLLSIGQMIEFLRNHGIVTIYNSTIIIGVKDKTIEYTELCDGLWEAVKQVLEK